MLKKRKNTLRFTNEVNNDFSKTLLKRVNQYFRDKNIDRYANTQMVVKTICMFLLYLVPYALILMGIFGGSIFAYFALCVVMGLGKAGIGLCIMHDANHGAYSRKKWINNILSYSMNLVGGNSMNWKIQHNVMHHTYTNIVNYDEDISPPFMLRFHPHGKKLFIHKFQFIYAWVFYGMMTMSWIFVKDIVQLIRYTKEGLLKKHSKNVGLSWTWLILTKIIYYIYMFVLPILLTPFAWYIIVIGVLVVHYMAGSLLSFIFQPAHVMNENIFVKSEKEKIEENWYVHQLKTTCNFANKSWFISWFAGGLNFQIEHHLFPNICHIHYSKISKIVKKTAQEFNIPYHSYKTFFGALFSHGKMLYKLGRI